MQSLKVLTICPKWLPGWTGQSANATLQCCQSDSCFWPGVTLLFKDEQLSREPLSQFGLTDVVLMQAG